MLYYDRGHKLNQVNRRAAMSFYKQQREQVKQIIINTSISLFKEKGYENVTVEDITKTVGIAKGTFYNFYASKADILLLWIEQKLQQMNIDQIANKNISMEESLQYFIKMLLAAVKEEQSLFVSMLEEYINLHYEKSGKEKLDFKKILHRVITGSRDYADIGANCIELKLKVLSRSLFMEMLSWYYSMITLKGLEEQLEKVVKICLYGLLRNIDDL
jgi:AcrR family transcriptional regulator